MKRYEVRLGILNEEYVDILIVALTRQGYDVYLNQEEKVVCFTATEDDIEEIKT